MYQITLYDIICVDRRPYTHPSIGCVLGQERVVPTGAGPEGQGGGRGAPLARRDRPGQAAAGRVDAAPSGGMYARIYFFYYIYTAAKWLDGWMDGWYIYTL